MNLIFALFTVVVFAACENKDSYVDLSTGEKVELVEDSTTGRMVNAETKKPVRIYVNTATHDTIYGPTGKVINNEVVKTSDGKYVYKDDEMKIKTTDTDSKIKIDENGDGDYDYKKKVERDGDIKIKDGDTKIKIEADGKTKIKKD